MNESTQEMFEQWAILELMGHVRLAGRVTEEEHFGAKLGRIDIPGPDGRFVTQFFGGGSVYRLTPTTEEIARVVAAKSAPAPVGRWEMDLSALLPPTVDVTPGEDDWDDEDDF